MTVGLLPALGGGIRELQAGGQAPRLIDGYLRPYAAAFGRLAYFSYLVESLAEFTDDRELLERVEVLAPPRSMSRGWRAVTMSWSHPAEFRTCAVLRVFQVTGTIPAILAAARFGVPYVTTYGFWYGRLSRPGPKRLLKRVVEFVGLRRAAAVIATTEELRARAARLARRVEIIPNGVDTRLFAPAAPTPAAPGTPRRVLFVGRLSAEKNLSALVTAAARLRTSVPVGLVFVGAGPLEDSLRRQAREAGVSLELHGVVDQRRLPALYASADAFVLASFTEGHPKVLLEAMSSGLPCVASDCAGNRSLVVDGLTGLLFDARQPDELADRLERVLRDPTLAATLGRAAREAIVERYDLSACVAREIALLGSLGRSGTSA
ncbi:MAG: glycosyltransferase family 4 protein [Chloroflexota bacterium]